MFKYRIDFATMPTRKRGKNQNQHTRMCVCVCTCLYLSKCAHGSANDGQRPDRQYNFIPLDFNSCQFEPPTRVACYLFATPGEATVLIRSTFVSIFLI